MNDLYSEMQVKTQQLNYSIKELRKTGTAYATAEKEYKIKLHTEVLKLRDEGVAVGVIDKICYGVASVAEARFQRDVAEVTYRANLEAINSLKLQIRIIENQISREWGTPMSD